MPHGNASPIFSSIGHIAGSTVLTTASADYTGQGILNQTLIKSAATYGSFIQRLRFKALGTNTASVCRIYINDGGNPRATVLAAVTGTPTGTPSASGGTLATGPYFAKIYAVDQYNGITAASTETASVSVTGPTGSIAWAWTAVTGAVKYYITVGQATGAQISLFEAATNSYTQTGAITGTGFLRGPVTSQELFAANANYFYGEVSLPGTTIIATAATVDIDYPMNIALEPDQGIVVGLGTTVAAGWVVTAIGGDYTP
jgi:hypothetical protein